MVSKAAAILLLYILVTCPAIAQPTLPDITGIADKGSVVLSWNCQYNKVKAISVFRSSDSTNDFTLIGYVENVKKGIQTFTDTHPLPGNNCYNAVLGFKSGLTWRSNHYCIHMEKYIPEQAPPRVTAPEAPKPVRLEKESDNIKYDIHNNTATQPASTTEKSPKPAPPKIKLPSALDDTIENPSAFIKSRYIITDETTGHMDMFLPDDVSEHHYSIKFYDAQNHMIIEIPGINSAKIIIDKRNFQRKGTYKFILRKDYTELESGYITISDL